MNAWLSPQEKATETPTQQQLDGLKRLSGIARVPNKSEAVTSNEEAEKLYGSD
ncbi:MULTISPECIES: hypothetical protein [unclassified Bradyrhizobium]|uniref:hypothetical protein n=1 Tax=unclassified Bradyrhizobium TaxID=2631580 RepID=UPI00247ABD75|nr:MULTISPECIES: hypothetical protein [unclassified Bradyrhizobium]WGR70291.1 hypothetical protein MTX24_33700 [Bradyrhizobium sp. ISRA426]WGR82350.1 hypothetical protein MTX21_18805 [Bradyrhizobium sp. ISRA430]WGR85536.1 hypothetical protein MTX25_33385 [Bradyrhizobium sp. ISRA432]